jgi:hypothetical protein
MKILKISLHPDKSNDEESTKKVREGKLLSSLLIIFLFSGLMLLQSCAVFIGGPGHGNRHGIHGNGVNKGNNGNHGNNGNNGHNQHHK